MGRASPKSKNHRPFANLAHSTSQAQVLPSDSGSIAGEAAIMRLGSSGQLCHWLFDLLDRGGSGCKRFASPSSIKASVNRTGRGPNGRVFPQSLRLGNSERTGLAASVGTGDVERQVVEHAIHAYCTTWPALVPVPTLVRPVGPPLAVIAEGPIAIQANQTKRLLAFFWGDL